MPRSSDAGSVSIAAPVPETHDAILAEPRRGGPRELERVGLAQRRVVASVRDPRRERELVEQLRELRRRRLDHLDVAVVRWLEASPARERRREAVHGRERRPQVVAREGDEPGEVGVVGHCRSNLAEAQSGPPSIAPINALRSSRSPV